MDLSGVFLQVGLAPLNDTAPVVIVFDGEVALQVAFGVELSVGVQQVRGLGDHTRSVEGVVAILLGKSWGHRVPLGFSRKKKTRRTLGGAAGLETSLRQS